MGEKVVFAGAQEVDLVDRLGGIVSGVVGVEIRPETVAGDARGALHRQHALGGNAAPIGDRRLGDTQRARERADATGRR